MTFAAVTVPLPLVTVQVWPDACVRTVTAYAEPLAIGVLKPVVPSAETVRLSPPLSCRTRLVLAARPDTVAPTLYVLLEQLTATVLTAAAATVPPPLATVQVCPVGCVRTVTA